VLERPSEVSVTPGAGVTATVGTQRVHVGTYDFVQPGAQDDHPAPGRAASSSVSYVAIDRKIVGTIEVADPPAAGAKEVVEKLRALAIEPVMITGDREAAARWIAGEVGISKIHAGVQPIAKATIVESERGDGHLVAMVGDGINDAPALAVADLGIAVGTGTDVAVAAADVTLIHGGIERLPTALTLARATLHTIRRNLIAAFAYNLVCIPIAAAGFLSPMVASAAMSLSSISVLLSSLGLRRFSA
jgi:Cu+-exporting ATPase